MKAFKRMLQRKRTKWLLLSLILGCLCLSFSINLSDWFDSQSDFYNRAMVAYRAGNAEEATSLFAKSQSAYQVNAHRDADRSLFGLIARAVLPTADRALSARASFQVAKVYMYTGQLPKAVQALNQSLLLNPGNGYLHAAPSDAEIWRQHAMYVKYDLELLYQQNQSQMQAQAQGQQDGGGSPQDGDPQSSNRGQGNDPSQGASGQGGSGQNSGSDM